MKTRPLFFVLTRFSVKPEADFTPVPSPDEWQALFTQAQRQALTGVLFAGIARLPEDRKPPRSLLLKWCACADRIEAANRELNIEAKRVIDRLRADGLRAVLLKGQGVAMLYPEPLLRTPGDIDLWIRGPREATMRYARQFDKHPHTTFLHTTFHMSGLTQVEAHFRPTFMYSPIHDRRLMQVFGKMEQEQFNHLEALPENAGNIPVPTPAFNRIYLLAHIFRHFLDEGIGLRQLIDYYYCLQQGFTDEQRLTALRQLRKTGLRRFAGAVMYVEQEVFGLDDAHCLVPPDERSGRLLLREIMQAGNFGRYDKRFGVLREESKQRKFLRKWRRNLRFLCDYPAEVLWDPLFRLWHFCWRKYKGYF